jgi:prepilin-type N-terminal cleavage/methylation domain-containing protein
MNQYIEQRNERGFTLIELLIAIVVVGILAAVAIVGIAGLTNTGSKSACTASADAAKAASAAYYANHNNTWPTTFTAMTTDTPPEYEAPASADLTGGTPVGSLMKVGSWSLQLNGGGTTPVTFTGCP